MSVLSALLAVVIVAHDPGFTTSLANHIQRWLRGEQIAARVIGPAAMDQVLQQERLAFLVGFASPSKSEVDALRAFRRRGGKMVVFHSSSAPLAEMMGVKPVGYRAAAYPGEFSRMDFVSKHPEGLPSVIRQTSTVLHRARAVAGRSRVLATWSDRGGRSTGEPAWLASDAGYWMTHVLSADGDEDLKARFLGAIVGSVDPQAWNYAAHLSRRAATAKSLRSYAERQSPKAGEIHAVWDHSGCGLYPGNWPRTAKILKASRVTDLFVNVAGAGFAHYPSAVLPRSRIFQQEGDQLAAAVAAAHSQGIRVHAWLLCFTATRGSATQLAAFAKKGWRLRNGKGALTEYVDPGNEDVRNYVLSAVDELQSRYAVDGVHLDFVRYGEGTVRPKDAALNVTRFVSEARRCVKRPKWLTAAVYGKYPACCENVAQDWASWLDLNLVDYVVPMNYTESNLKFAALLAQQSMPRSHAHRTIVGIGVTANESRLDARQVIDQINLSRSFGFAGVSLFDLDTMLEKSIFVYLTLGIW